MKICLVVDDSPVIRKVARRILESMNFVVAEAEDGLDALEKCDHNMPDVVLVDCNMPKMDGIEFIEALRTRETADDTKILFSTSEIMVSEMTRAKRAGCQGYLLKPYTKSIVMHKLSEIGVTSIAA